MAPARIRLRGPAHCDLPGPARPTGVSAETPAGRCSSGSASDGPAAHTGWDELGIPTVRHDCDRSGRVLSRHGNDAERAVDRPGRRRGRSRPRRPLPGPRFPGPTGPVRQTSPPAATCSCIREDRLSAQRHVQQRLVQLAAGPTGEGAPGHFMGGSVRPPHGVTRAPVNAAASRRRPRRITGQVYRRWQTARSAASDVTPPGHRRGQFPLPPPPPSPFPLPSPWPWGLSAPVTTTWLPAATWPLGCTDTTVPGSC
jgi:hypothetical protein